MSLGVLMTTALALAMNTSAPAVPDPSSSGPLPLDASSVQLANEFVGHPKDGADSTARRVRKAEADPGKLPRDRGPDLGGVTAIPEPASALLLAAGALIVGAMTRGRLK